MIKAVLLDLDDTLLRNRDSAFVPAYLDLVDIFFRAEWGFNSMSQVLRNVIQAAIEEHDIRQTNAARAEAIIAQATGQSLATIRAAFGRFYAEVYPQLTDHTAPVPDALALYEYLRERDYAIVIATNPLYPMTAIQQRLAWAGLPDDLEAYALVTSADNMHFVKPDPAYYAEIVARVGIEPDEALMVGDSLENDIQPASALGLKTFYVTSAAESRANAGTLTTLRGKLADGQWLEDHPAPTPRPAAIAPQMRGNLGALFGLLDDVCEKHWHQHPDPKEWSIMEVVCHLFESEKTIHRPRLERILTENNPFLTDTVTPAGVRRIPPCAEDGQAAANKFLVERQQTLELLAQLADEDWQRPARHSIFGLTTLWEMAYFTAQHDRLHLNQICQTLGHCQE
jgi:HAD superfamily hydrolase (TIGR01549 family)